MTKLDGCFKLAMSATWLAIHGLTSYGEVLKTKRYVFNSLEWFFCFASINYMYIHNGGSPVFLREEVELYMASLLLRPLYSQSGFQLGVLAQYVSGAFEERQVFFC